MTSFTDTWNGSFSATPADTEDASLGAQRIRETKRATKERVQVDHSLAGDTHDGKHKKVTFKAQGSDPTLDADDVAIYAKEVSSVTELFYQDENGTVKQITSGGRLKAGILDGTLLSKNANYTLLTTDVGTIVLATGAVDLTLPAASDLEDGEGFGCYNIGTSTVRFLRAGADTIDNAATSLTVPPYTMTMIIRKSASSWAGINKDIIVATQAEVNAGTSETVAVTPKVLAERTPDTATPVAADDFVLFQDASAAKEKKCTIGALLVAGLQYACLEDQKATTVQGGSASAGWNTRVLNTEVVDANAIVSISANQFTLAAGTYYIRGVAPAYAVNGHQTRIRNITDGSTALLGASHYAGNVAVSTISEVCGMISIAGAKAFELQSFIEVPRSGSDLGAASSSGATEVYSRVEIWKLS